MKNAIRFVTVSSLAVFLFGTFGVGEELPSAATLLERSIHYHDPDGRWMSEPHRLVLRETRPNGPSRKTTVVIDNHRNALELARHTDDGQKVELSVEGNRVRALLNGSTEFSEEEGELHRISPTRAIFWRNYYAYLYGLPMKLRDPGTRLDPKARVSTFQGREAYELRVTYDEGVGSDTWYFYLDPKTFALIGYRFYHDESKNDGEYITLEEVAAGGGVRLPRVRKWYMHADDRFLGTDTIESIETARR